MRLIEGWWLPDIMEHPGGFPGRARQIHEHVKRVAGRKVAVQAGGHIGCYPKVLAEYFETVYTFEPEDVNFDCLMKNVTEPNVVARRACLGDSNTPLGLKPYTGRNTGKFQVAGKGKIPCFRIDDLHLSALDMLVIDVEGYEIPVLEGARKSLEQFLPVIVAEENSRLLQLGYKYGDIERKLAPLGYKVVERMGEDIILTAR